MGYYSDTALTLTKKGVEALSNKLTDRETPEETRGEVQDLLSQADSHYTNSSSGAMVWHWAWNKWYSDFSEVAFVESLMHEMDDEDYLFIRIGEDYADTETRGCFWENPFGMELNRSIAQGKVR